MDAAEVRELLEGRRRELSGELTRLTSRPADPTPSVSFGKRVGDGTTEAVERINQTAAARSLDAALREVGRALAKLDEDSYGSCDVCGSAIAPERLEAIPWTPYCRDCSARRSRAR